MYSYDAKSRPYLIFSILTLSLLALLIRLVYLQSIRSAYLSSLAAEQYSASIKLKPARGSIYDRNMRQLATSLKRRSLYANSRELNEKERLSLARELAPILGLKEEAIAQRLSKNKGFIWIARRLEDERADKIAGMELKGIGFVEEDMRFYPQGRLASHVIGFTGIDDNGLEGLERFYDNYLKGENGWLSVFRDAKRRSIVSLNSDFTPPIEGYNLVLNIDAVIQSIAEDALDEAYMKYKFASAMVIVMEPASGDILALANRPAYDPNDLNSFGADSRRNRAVADMFEPGSVFKVVTASGGINDGVVTLEDKFYGENGAYRINGRILHDHKPYQWLTFSEVVIKSSNIGIAKVAERLGEDELYRYASAFGFGERTGIDSPGEIKGVLRPVSKWSKLSLASIPMGQEVGVTAIQLASAISVIANGGLLVEPHIARAVLDKNGNAVREFRPVIKRRVISGETASLIKDILVGAVENGTGKRARVSGYLVAGKTGTAQKIEPDGRYSHSRYVASFMGFAPAENPAISVVVVIDEPKSYHYGGAVAAPIFSEIAGRTLRYLNVPYNKVMEAKLN